MDKPASGLLVTTRLSHSTREEIGEDLTMPGNIIDPIRYQETVFVPYQNEGLPLSIGGLDLHGSLLGLSR